MTVVEDWYEDSRAMLQRAVKHCQEYNALMTDNVTWSIEEREGNVPNTFTYSLVLNAEALTSLKPVAADIANNLVHSADQLIAACARMRGHDRRKDTYFPWDTDDAKFSRKVRALREIVGQQATDQIEKVRESYRNWFPHLQAIKEISNSGKHWSLYPSEASALAVVAIDSGNRSTSWDLPPNAFSGCPRHDFATNVTRLNDPRYTIVMNLRFYGLLDDVSASPQDIFSTARRFVQDNLDAIEGANGT